LLLFLFVEDNDKPYTFNVLWQPLDGKLTSLKSKALLSHPRNTNDDLLKQDF